MYKIKFNVEGWRGIVAKDFTVENVARIASAIATWLTRKHTNPSAVIGHDTRFGGEMFMEIIAKVLAARGVKVFVPEDFVTSPMVSLGTVKLSAQCGIIISASHYPAEYNGIKIKNASGAPVSTNELKDIETLIPNEVGIDLELISWNTMLNQQMIQYIDLENVYIKEIHDHFNVEHIKSALEQVRIDTMYGSSQRLMKKLFGENYLIHAEINPTFKGIAPHTVFKNLSELAMTIEMDHSLQMGLAMDGDADRIALLDEKGNYIDAHWIILLLIHYLAGYKEEKGTVVISYPVTSRVETLCDHYGLKVLRGGVGFVELSRKLEKEDFIIVAEDNGGIKLNNCAYERDGAWVTCVLLEMLWKTQRTIGELLTEVNEITGKFVCQRKDISLSRKDINSVVRGITEMTDDWDGMQIEKLDNRDVFKISRSDNEWGIIRPSGKEAALRVYMHTIEEKDMEQMTDSFTRLIHRLISPIGIIN